MSRSPLLTAARHGKPRRPRREHVLRITTTVGVGIVMVMLLTARPAAGATHAWTTLPAPWKDVEYARDLGTFAPTGLVAVGAGGRAAVSTSGGLGWVRRSPAGDGFTRDLNGVAFLSASRGVTVGNGGTLLLTTDGGRTWRHPQVPALPPGTDLNDVALSTTAGFVVGDDGLLLASSDGGASWQLVPTPTTAHLTDVAMTATGVGVAGASDGSVLVGEHASWHLAWSAGAAVTGVAAATAPVWGDGSPDLFVVAAHTVYGSDDRTRFALVLAQGATYAEPLWSMIAWQGAPQADALLLAGAPGGTGFFSPGTAQYLGSDPGLAKARDVAARSGHSVAYVLDTRGRIARTLSAGRTAGTLQATPARLTAGDTLRLQGSAWVAAPGEVIVQRRRPGSGWGAVKRIDWRAGDWGRTFNLDLRPRLTSEYRLAFAYGGRATTLTDTSRVVVDPRLTPDKLTYDLRRGRIYRFTGRVFPALPGERVQLYTDRGGGWHRIDLGGVVKLRDGVRWVSRRFGTPKAETYHLKARMTATRRHGEAWSPVVTVRIR